MGAVVGWAGGYEIQAMCFCGARGEFFGESRADAMRSARGFGWRLSKDRETAECSKCAHGKERPR